MNIQDIQPSHFEMVIKLIEIIIWPITLFVIILLFKRNFQSAFQRLGSIKADATGIAITFEKQLEATKQLFDKIKPRAVSKSSTSIKPSENQTGTAYNQVLTMRKDLVNFLKRKSEVAGFERNISLPTQMCTKLVANNIIETDQAQMIEALLNLTAKATTNTSQAQADSIQQLFNKIEL
jgi:hypothetical protein